MLHQDDARLQDKTQDFQLSGTEDWATHRRIIGNVWGAGWQLQKALFAESMDGEDKRVVYCIFQSQC